MELNATGHTDPAGALVLFRVTTVATEPIVPDQVHNEATPIEEVAVILHDLVRVLTGPIRHVDPPIRDQIRLQAGVLVTGGLPARIAQGARAAEVPGIEVPEGAHQAEVLATEVQAEARGAQAVPLEVPEGRSGLQEVHSDLAAAVVQVAADQVAADQVADEADNNIIIRL